MRSLKSLNLKSVYRTGRDDLYKDFYSPALSVSQRYDRAVGFFSSEILAMSLKGISNMVKSGGSMRLIIGHPLEHDEFEAVKQGLQFKDIVTDLSDKLELMLSNPKPNMDRLKLLAWLIACNRLEIRFALRKVGMYHEKIGVFTDQDNHRVVFQGSANETPHGMISTLNAESISVYKSWEEDIFEAYGLEYIDGFERLWSNEEENTLTLQVPSETYENISKCVAESGADIFSFVNFEAEIEVRERRGGMYLPEVPQNLGGNKFDLFNHQKNALSAWKSNEYKGILKLATGSGKTITSIYGAVKVFEARQKQEQPLFLIIAVPYIELALQWVDNLTIFNIYPHQCFDSKDAWYKKLYDQVQYFNASVTPFIAAVVVNKTLASEHFQALIQSVHPNSIMFIGDECHSQGGKRVNDALPQAFYRLGLSATPFRSDEDEIDSPFPDESKSRLLEYYGDIVDEYSLADAINDRVLTPYEYKIIIVYLTPEEEDLFEDISKKIQRLVIKSKAARLTTEERESLTRFSGQRSRLLGSAQNKLVKLKEITKNIPQKERYHTLFYSGEGSSIFSEDNHGLKVIDQVSEILSDNGWKTSQFTSQNTRSQRRSIMNAFKEKTIDGLVAMKVLDEGIDVPVCQTAYILASTKNPRQYIQRRGRILRKSKGKDLATIYDFVVLPSTNSSAAKNLKKSEAERINDFTLLATNKIEIESIIQKQGLTYDQF